MGVTVTIVDGPISTGEQSGIARASDECGAVVRFEGIVRRTELGRALAALHYEVYDPMAMRELTRLGGLVSERHALISLSVIHSRGEVPVGRCSLLVEVSARHRGEALAAVAEFIDLLKRDVPIWKRAVWA